MVEAEQTDVVYTDFAKDFDKLDHAKLLSKLRRVGVRGCLLKWVKRYLTNRQRVEYHLK